MLLQREGKEEEPGQVSAPVAEQAPGLDPEQAQAPEAEQALAVGPQEEQSPEGERMEAGPEEDVIPEEEKEAQQVPVGLGKIKIERPKIEYYDVTGTSVREVADQLLKNDEWYEYEYKYALKVENGVVVEVNVLVIPTIKLPRWEGPTWQQSSDRDKSEWLKMLAAMDIDPSLKIEEDSALPGLWLDPDWETAPKSVKGEWREMLQAMQKEEEGYADILMRHAIVLQQRMYGQPESQVKSIFDQFLKDLKKEREKYDRQMEFGKRKRISLEASAMVQ
jgi:hypothetical protein